MLVQVSHCGAAVPTCKELDDIRTAPCGEQGHSTACSEGGRTNQRWFDAHDQFRDTCMDTDRLRDLAGLDWDTDIVVVVI